MSYQSLILSLKGGSGSGNHGHAGIPGKVGGSLPGGGYSPEKYDEVNFINPETGKVSKGQVWGIRANGDLVIVGGRNDVILSKNDVWELGTKKPSHITAVAVKPDNKPEESVNNVNILNSYNEVKGTSFGKGYMITGKGQVVDISDEFGGGTNDHVGYIALSSKPEMFGLTANSAKRMLRGYEDGDSDDVMQGWDKFHRSGGIRVREFGNDVAINTDHVDVASLRKLQKLYDSNKLGIKPGQNVIWEGNSDYKSVESPAEDFLNAKYVTAGGLK